MDLAERVCIPGLDRRRFLQQALGVSATAAIAGTVGCFAPRPELRVLASRRPLPKPFAANLQLPPVLRPAIGQDGIARLGLTAQSGEMRIFPDAATAVRGYNGIFPGPTIEVQEGQRLLLLLENRLDQAVVNHLHGGNTPASSDGFPTDLIAPMRAGDAIPRLEDCMAAARGNGWQVFEYPNTQRGTLLWYHDHRMDRTGLQVWEGLVGAYLLRSPSEAALGLPSGEREVLLVLTDRSFDEHGQMSYPMGSGGSMVAEAYMGGVLGDVQLVNGVPWPRLNVPTGQMRLRVLNASNARAYELELDRDMPAGYQFAQIGSDGGLLDRPQFPRRIHLAPAERVDLLVDFAGCAVGTPIHLVNVAERGAMQRVLRFVPTEKVSEKARVPDALSSDALPSAGQGMVERSFDFRYDRVKREWTINGHPYDASQVLARPKLGTTEIWHLRSDFSHPVHLHLVHFAVMSHAGRRKAADAGWKDTVSLFAGEEATIVVPFTGHRGRYVFHCHNLEHEDMRMMGNFEVI